MMEMSESDLNTYADFASRRYLPSRRTEIMLARLCMYVEAYMGGRKNAKLADYLLDPRVEEEEDLGDNDDELKAYFGFNPINVKD